MTAEILHIEDYWPLYQGGLALHRSGGLPKGSSTGWWQLDELYTVGMGQWTVVTGMPGSGKSEWLDAMLVNMAEREPWKFAVYSPENYPTETHLVKLCEKRARKPFGDGPNQRMTEQEYTDAAFWVMDRFMWLSPDLKTPEELISTALSFHSEGRKFGIVLDPWNTLEHQRGGMSETDYVSLVLTEVTKMARASKAHVWLVVHPAKMQRNKDGTRPVPTPYDISGSAHWYNKADNIITVHRDQAGAVDGPNKGQASQDVEIHVQKVRFKHIGHAGALSLKYDRVTGRYFHMTGGMAGEFYADPERGEKPPTQREPGSDDE